MGRCLRCTSNGMLIITWLTGWVKINAFNSGRNTQNSSTIQANLRLCKYGKHITGRNLHNAKIDLSKLVLSFLCNVQVQQSSYTHALIDVSSSLSNDLFIFGLTTAAKSSSMSSSDIGSSTAPADDCIVSVAACFVFGLLLSYG